MANDWGDEALNDWGDMPEQSGPAKPAGRATAGGPGQGEAFLRSAVQGFTGNLSDELAGRTAEAGARLQAQADKAFPLVPPGPRQLAKAYPGVPYLQAQAQFKADWLAKNGYRDFGEAAQAADRAFLDPAHAAEGQQVRDVVRAGDRAAREAYPLTSLAGNVAGSLPLMALAPVQAPGGLLAKAAAGARAGAPIGAVYGLGGSESEDLAGKALDTGVGAGVGGAAGYVAPLAMTGLRAAGRAILPQNAAARVLRLTTPRLTPTPEAERLAQQGVPLTTGQLNPDSFVNTLEQASDRAALGLGPQRAAAQEAWRDVVLKQPLAGGQRLPAGGTAEKLEGLYQGFGPQYAAVRGRPVPAAALEELPGKALSIPKGIDERTRQAAAGEIKNALTILPEKEAAASATVDDLLKVRSNLREQLRAAQHAQDWDRMRIVGHAADTVTDTINGSLDDPGRAALAAADARYRSFAVIEDAAARGGLSGDFTPRQLGAALKAAEGRRSFTQGGGGALRGLADDAAAVFSPTVMPTGMRAAVTAALPGWSVAPVARIANTPFVRSAMLREPLPPLVQATQGRPLDLAALQAALERARRKRQEDK